MLVTALVAVAEDKPADVSQPVLMSAEWAKAACDTWNADPVLTDKLVESGWADNHAGRGFKVMQVYRLDCKDAPRVELRVSKQDKKAKCVYGGKVESKLNMDVDYVMYAETARWQEMGKGEYGPMKAMMFGRLKFEGPMLEAMGNMGPFENFLLLTGKVPSDAGRCPVN
jgi:putative sterol carrier protein